jgi:DNA-binding transcriptional MocR family regulator
MQQVMKRQVQNYIMRQLQAGQANLNVKEAARDLGITEQQVVVAYQQLEAEGWFRQSTGGMENGKQETPQASAPETSAEGSAEEQWRRRSGTGAHQDNVFGGKESQF